MELPDNLKLNEEITGLTNTIRDIAFATLVHKARSDLTVPYLKGLLATLDQKVEELQKMLANEG